MSVTGCYRYADLTISSELDLLELPSLSKDKVWFPALTFNSLTMLAVEPSSVDWVFHGPTQSTQSAYSLAKTEGGFLLRLGGMVYFAITDGERQISVWLASKINDETLRHLLLDQVLPRLLAHRGRLVLHAGAVGVDDCAIAFVGETGSGKSTLTASFRTVGHPSLSDDGLVLNPIKDGVTALPTYPSLRLWPESVARLYAEPPTLAPMAHYSTKRRVVLNEDEAVNQPLPLAAIYVLAPVPETAAVTISLKRLCPTDACMTMVENSFQLDVTDTRRAAGLLAEMAKVVQHVPVFRLTYPHDFELLPTVRTAILSHREYWADAGMRSHSG